MFINTLIVLVVLIAVVSSVRVFPEPEVKVFHSQYWEKVGVTSATEPIQVVFSLKFDKAALAKHEEILLDISNPKSINYGKWLNNEQIIEMVGSSNEKVGSVLAWLNSFGVEGKVGNFKTNIFATIPAGVASTMFDTEFANFRSLEKSDVVLPRITRPYSLPEEIAAHVSFVDDIMRFPTVRKPLTLPRDFTEEASAATFSCGNQCIGDTTPSVLESAYNITRVSSAAAGNTVAVAEFQGQYYDDADLQAFSSQCQTTVQVATTIGGNNPSKCMNGLQPCVEALLDIEYLGALAYPIPMTVIYQATYSLLTWDEDLNALPNPPLVNSVSYGNDEVQQTSAAYMDQVNAAFQISASKGLSILFASGDQGVWGRTGTCNQNLANCTYHPDFPAGAPYVTAVGGTNFQTKSTIGAESTWNCGGGGFSDHFVAPSWQTSDISNYFTVAGNAKLLPKASLYNSKGRGYPDVAALGGQTNPYCVSYKGGTFGGVAGTSASCPVFAGVVGVVNNARLAAKKSPLGFLNPFLYSVPHCFKDVNDLTANYCNAGYSGFNATVGWDPATGLGTPNTGCLVTEALKLP